MDNKIKLIDFLDSVDVLEDYDLGVMQMWELMEQCIDKNKYEDETLVSYVPYSVNQVIFEIVSKAFKIGYLHGYKHYKDNGEKAITDYTFQDKKIIDINKQLNDFIKNHFYPSN